MFPILLGKNNDLEKRVKTLEDSGGGGGSIGISFVEISAVYNSETDTYMLNKTWKEIFDALSDSTIYYYIMKDSTGVYIALLVTAGSALSYVINDTLNNIWTADSENGYPYLT